MTPDLSPEAVADFLARISSREHRHDYDLGTYWNACEDAADALRALSAELARLQADREAMREDARRYQVVRCLNVPQFQKVYTRNMETGESFDGLIDSIGSMLAIDAAMKEKP